MKRIALTVAAAAWAACLAVPLSSQAPFTSIYDRGRTVKLQGIVTRVEWVNPAAFVFINVRDATGATASWGLEVGSPLDLERAGWKRTTVRIGDSVSVEGFLARGDARQAFASVFLSGAGKRLFSPPAARPAIAAGRAPAPRWPDGQVRLGPAAGAKGYWGAASAHALVENGAKAAVNDDGLLMNVADAGSVAPLQPWAKAVYEYRQRTLLKDDPLARCLPAGGPRQFLLPHGVQFIEQRELGRILVLHGGGNRNWRVIHTDGRPQVEPDVLSYYGNSTGRWDKDTLVVDSVGFNEKFWFTSGGLPHTEALHLIERFTRTDLNTLKYDVTVDDSRTYTRPWSGGWTLQWVPGQEIQEHFCEEGL